MLSSEGRWRSRFLALVPRVATATCLFVVPGCLLVQPLDDVNEDGSAGEGGSGGTSATGGGGRGGSSTGGKGGGSGGSGGATGGGAGKGGNAGKGGSDVGGGAGRGGAGGAGGTSGAAGSGNTGNVSLVYGPVWTFDEDTEGFALGYSEPTTLAGDATAAHDPDDGAPNDGSVVVTIPFDGPSQTVELGVTLPVPLDLTSKTLAARVKLDSGFFGDTLEPGGVKIFVKTGDDFRYADGTWSDLVSGQWLTVVFDLDSPDFDDMTNPADVRELGLAFKSTAAADAGWTTATLHVDTVGWVGAERPPCIFDPLLIDDLETSDGFGATCMTGGRDGGWYVYDDGTMGATRTPSTDGPALPLEETQGPNGTTTQAVHVRGMGYTGWGGGVGTTLVPGNTTNATFWDASEYAGISFWAKGSGIMFLQAVLAETRSSAEEYPGLCEPILQLNCNDNYAGNQFTLTETWTRYDIPFATMNQEGWDKPVPWSYNVNALEFRWTTDDAGFDFWIDDVRFIPRECDDGDDADCAAGGDKCVRGTLVPTACNAECTKRGYTMNSCSAMGGCACDTPTNPNLEDAIDAFCQCAGPTLECMGEGRALLEALASDSMNALGTTILCYADYAQADQCDEALTMCWPQ
jgi:hypothetical protein